MPGVTKEQIEQARKWDLLSYLQAFEPEELKKSGPHEYSTVTHNSLKISKGLWCWNSHGIGGKTALDFLVKVRGLGFVEGVRVLTGNPCAAYQAPVSQSEPPKKPFALPEASRYPAAVVSYLQRRGIDADIISQCIEKGILYESRRYQNCVFVGKDPAGVPRFACLRGTRDKFRIDMESSDKRYNFQLAAADSNCPFLVAAESPIDVLSLATLMKMQGGDWTKYHYLSLGGTNSRALLQFLHDHPKVTHISLCLDNDSAGLTGIEKLTQAILDNAALSKRVALVHPNPPPIKYGKDYNDCLQAQAAILQKEKSMNRQTNIQMSR